MLRTGMLARLLVPALGVVAIQALVAGEPADKTAPAQSIREWRATTAATPTAPAKSIREWTTAPGPTPAASSAATPTPPAKSIREWRTTPVSAPGPCPTTTPIANLPATSAGSPSPTSAITISIKSTLRQGNLVVMLDDVPIFNEKFQKPLLIISQTTTWDPLQVAAGTHRLSAKVHGTKKTYLSKSYDLQVSASKGATLHFVMQGDKLTVALGS